LREALVRLWSLRDVKWLIRNPYKILW
jgi:hypothetical protein